MIAGTKRELSAPNSPITIIQFLPSSITSSCTSTSKKDNSSTTTTTTTTITTGAKSCILQNEASSVSPIKECTDTKENKTFTQVSSVGVSKTFIRTAARFVLPSLFPSCRTEKTTCSQRETQAAKSYRSPSSDTTGATSTLFKSDSDSENKRKVFPEIVPKVSPSNHLESITSCTNGLKSALYLSKLTDASRQTATKQNVRVLLVADNNFSDKKHILGHIQQTTRQKVTECGIAVLKDIFSYSIERTLVSLLLQKNIDDSKLVSQSYPTAKSTQEFLVDNEIAPLLAEESHEFTTSIDSQHAILPESVTSEVTIQPVNKKNPNLGATEPRVTQPAHRNLPHGEPRVKRSWMALVLMALTFASVTSCGAVELRLGILVAETCEENFLSRVTAKANKAISDFNTAIQTNNQQQTNDSSQTSQNSEDNSVNISFFVYPQCMAESVVSSLNTILSDSSTNAVLSLASYDIHSSFLPIAELYQKAYIPLNAYISTIGRAHSVSLMPSYFQLSRMMAKVLDRFQWQNVHIIRSDFHQWADFAVNLYFDLASQEFNVFMGEELRSPVTSRDADTALNKVGPTKVIVLLLDVDDQLTVLAAASKLSMTTRHVIFSFAKTPYDVTSASLLSVTSQTTELPKFKADPANPGVNIFESVFVIGPSFPEVKNVATTTAATVSRRRRSVKGNDDEIMPNSPVQLITQNKGDFRKARKPETDLDTDTVAFVDLKETSAISSTVSDRSSTQNLYVSTGMTPKNENISQFTVLSNERKAETKNRKLDSTSKPSNTLHFESSTQNRNKKQTIDLNITSKKSKPLYFSPSHHRHHPDNKALFETSSPQANIANHNAYRNSFSAHQDMGISVTKFSTLPGASTTDAPSSLRSLRTKTKTQEDSSSMYTPLIAQSSNKQKNKNRRHYIDLNTETDTNMETPVSKRINVPKVFSLYFQSENPDQNIDSYKTDSSENSLHSFKGDLAFPRVKRAVPSFKATNADLDAIYDAIYVLGSALYRNGTSLFGDDLIDSVSDLTVKGIFGEIKMDSNRRPSFDFAVYVFNVTSGLLESRLFYTTAGSDLWELDEKLPLTWPGRVVPGDECFKQLPNCEEGVAASYIIAIVIAVIGVIFIVIVSVIFIRRNLMTKELTKGPNKVIISNEDLVFVLRKDVGKGSRIMKSRATLDKDNTPDLLRGSADPNRSMASINELSDFTETARYNGDLVHVKELDIVGFEMKSKLFTYFRMLRDLRHENINPYVGFLSDPTRPSIVMEYCSRGSLHDIIHNDDFKLDWDFKFSLLADLVRGIRYIHTTPLKFHGHLTSKNCVIDSRFVLKISDYGVAGILERCKAQKTIEPREMLWSAPELLRDPALLQKGSDKGDIYSISIIFQEVALRTEPYSTTGLTPEEIVKKLKKPPPLIRPSVTPQAAPPQFIQIMKQCWSEMPEMRPTVDDVYDQFKKLTGGKKANIVDTMFKMLEKYSNDLEEIVAERTMQLEEEKKKTDQLLFRMLPATVAENLKMGNTVEAETFSEVSIYFSDIVGFTTISAMSTPMQVVDLLNDLYTMFDATIDNHDVYKVETIGDAYMCVSGLPIRNGNRHAGEIGTMALVLLSQCGQFTIRHMPHVPLRLRIGLHTGSCVAGVVGLTMPRYCLFGDTVNTASRMESTGAAFRIHISEAYKNVLDEVGGYIIEYRGKTELKGKGKQNTYWLIGKEGFENQLPEPPPMGDESHGLESILGGNHEFLAALNPPLSDADSKSTSAPNLATPLPDQEEQAAPSLPSHTSQPANLNELTTVHKGSCSQSNQHTSVVKADINTCVSGLGSGDIVGAFGDEDTVAGSETITNKLEEGNMQNMIPNSGEGKNRHSESNDSGFGSERKHSQGNETGHSTACPPATSSASGHHSNGEKASKRVIQQAGTRSSVVSSSDVNLHNNHVTLNAETSLDEGLAPVTEV